MWLSYSHTPLTLRFAQEGRAWLRSYSRSRILIMVGCERMRNSTPCSAQYDCYILNDRSTLADGIEASFPGLQRPGDEASKQHVVDIHLSTVIPKLHNIMTCISIIYSCLH